MRCSRTPQAQVQARQQRVRCASSSTSFVRNQAAAAASRHASLSLPRLPASPATRRSFNTRSSPSPENPTGPGPSTSPKTHYDLFPQTLPAGPPPSGPFHVDARTLRREFLSLQAKTHPDLAPPELKASAETTSAILNDAYKTLLNPLLRAQYLLSLRGVDVAEDETLKIEEPDLLMLVLEAREEIEDAESEEDLVEPRKVNDERIRESEEALDKAFSTDDIEAAKKEAVRMRYWVNIKDSLDAWEKGKPVVLQH